MDNNFITAASEQTRRPTVLLSVFALPSPTVIAFRARLCGPCAGDGVAYCASIIHSAAAALYTCQMASLGRFTAGGRNLPPEPCATVHSSLSLAIKLPNSLVCGPKTFAHRAGLGLCCVELGELRGPMGGGAGEVTTKLHARDRINFLTRASRVASGGSDCEALWQIGQLSSRVRQAPIAASAISPISRSNQSCRGRSEERAPRLNFAH